MTQRIHILGGDGYLGWPTAMALSQAGHIGHIFDNFAKRQWELEIGVRPLFPIPTLQERIRAWRNLPEVARWMYSDHAISAEEHARWFARALSDPGGRYWIIQLDGAPVGLANLTGIQPEHGRSSWAYYLADPAVRGKGVGAFVEFLVIEHAFGELGLEKLWCEVLADNEPVWKLHESFGFRREALFRNHVKKQGRPVDVVGLGLLASDWAQVRPAKSGLRVMVRRPKGSVSASSSRLRYTF